MADWIEVYRWLWRRLGTRTTSLPGRALHFLSIISLDLGRALALALVARGRDVAFVGGRVARLERCRVLARGGVAAVGTMLLFGPPLSLLGLLHPPPPRSARLEVRAAGVLLLDGDPLTLDRLGSALEAGEVHTARVAVDPDTPVRTVSEVNDVVAASVRRSYWRVTEPGSGGRDER